MPSGTQSEFFKEKSTERDNTSSLFENGNGASYIFHVLLSI